MTFVQLCAPWWWTIVARNIQELVCCNVVTLINCASFGSNVIKCTQYRVMVQDFIEDEEEAKRRFKFWECLLLFSSEFSDPFYYLKWSKLWFCLVFCFGPHIKRTRIEGQFFYYTTDLSWGTSIFAVVSDYAALSGKQSNYQLRAGGCNLWLVPIKALQILLNFTGKNEFLCWKL